MLKAEGATGIEPEGLDVQAIEPCEIQEIDPLLMLAAGMMCLAGAITIEEARDMAGLEPMSEIDWSRRSMIAVWCQNTGIPIPPSLMDFWPTRR